jgi:hypothetical protein
MSIQVSLAIQAAKKAKQAKIADWNVKQFMLNNHTVEGLAIFEREAIFRNLNSVKFWRERVLYYESIKEWRLMSMSIDNCNDAANNFEDWKIRYRETLVRLKSNRLSGKFILNLP